MSAEHPLPWRFEAEDRFEDWPIRDANGEPVVVTDSGFYPPDNETAREIVEAVNSRERLLRLLRRVARILPPLYGLAAADEWRRAMMRGAWGVDPRSWRGEDLDGLYREICEAAGIDPATAPGGGV